MQNSIKKNTLYNLVRTLSVIVFPMVRYPYLTRVLQPENFGKVNFANSILGYVTLFSMFGAEIYSVRELAKYDKHTKEYENNVGRIYTLTLLTTSVTLIFLGVCVLFIPILKDYALLIEIICMPVFFQAIGADWINIASADLGFISLRTLFFQIFATIATFNVIKDASDYYYYAIILGGTTIGMGISNLFYRQKICRFRLIIDYESKKHLKGIVFLFVLLFSQSIFLNLDITMLGIVCGDKEVGEYSVACSIYNISSTIISAISIVVIPRITEAIAKGDNNKVVELQEHSFEYIITMGIPIITGLNLLSRNIVTILAGDKYDGALTPLHLLSIALLVVMFGGAFLGNIVLLPANRERLFTVASLIAAFTNAILNALFIPFFGGKAAAVTTIISELIVLIILYFKGKSEIKTKVRLKSIYQPIISSLFFIPIHVLFERFMPKAVIWLFLEIIVDILLYFIILLSVHNGFAVNIIRRKK